MGVTDSPEVAAAEDGSTVTGGALPADRTADMTPEPSKAARMAPERQPVMKDFLRIFSYAKKLDWFLMAAGLFSSLGAGVTLPLMNVVFGKLVGHFSTFPSGGTDPATFQSNLDRQSLYIFILFLARFFLNYINTFTFRMISTRMSAAIRLDYLCCLFGQTIHALDSMPAGSAANTITTTANTLQLGISENLGTFVEFTTCILASVIVAFTFSWLLTLVVSSILLYILLVACITVPQLVKGEANLTRAETVANSIASESFANIRMLMACGAETKMAARYSIWTQKARQYGQSMSPYLATMFGNIFFSLYGGFALTFWFGMRQFQAGRINSVGTIIVVVMSVITTVVSVERVATPLIAASKAMVAACEFFTIIDAPRPEYGQLVEPDVTATEDIVFSGVDFAYPGRPHVKVLDSLDIRIAAGKVNAIVGPSGSGKSTIVGLVERWYSLQKNHYAIEKVAKKDEKAAAAAAKKKKKAQTTDANDSSEDNCAVEEGDALSKTADDGDVADSPPVELKGSVTTCGRSLDEIDVRWWRSQIGLVQQEPFLFDDTIFNNVAFGLVGSVHENAAAKEKEVLVEEACKEAFADEFINRLPDRYQTLVGESGTKLSGGQRQRIAIARSIVKKPKILILDEATSAIDVRSERIIQAALDRVSRNRTTITIAHRLSTIKSADKIFLLQKGRCVEEGTHESLLAIKGGLYHRLVTAQQLSLGDDSALAKEAITMKDDDAVGMEASGVMPPASGNKLSSDGTDDALNDDADPVSSGSTSGVADPAWKNKNFFGSFGRLLYEQRSGFPYYAALLVFAMGAAAAAPLQAYLFAKLSTNFGDLTSVSEGINIGRSIGQVIHDGNFYALMFFVMAIGTGIAYFSLGYLATHVEVFICAVYREQYFVSIIEQGVPFFDKEENASGTLTNHVGGDPKQLRQLLGSNMSMAATAVFTIIGALIVSFAFGWKLALLAFAVVVPLVLVSGFYRMRYEVEFQNMNAAVFAESSKWAAESIDAFRTVTALTLEEVICKRYEMLLAGHVHDAFKKARYKTLMFSLSNSISLACQALVYWYGGRLILSGEYTATGFFVCYMAAIQGSESAGQSLSFLPNVSQVTLAANRILGIRETKSIDRVPLTEKIPETDTEDDARIGNRGACIELRNIHFRYPTRNVPVFRGLDLTIERGKYTAIVGASGSGKTTIISLIERFYSVEKGTILCNGRDLGEVNVSTYRKLLSLVAQEPALFQGTVRENVLLGVDDDTVTEEDIIQACRDASIHDFVASLPDGYNTNLGNRAVSLSGGQKQRLAIARALLRNPRVLLLDETTSFLDSETEKIIQATLERVAQGRTTVAVAHRLSTVQNADVIYVLGDGAVLEKGNHSSLLSQRGVYWSMCQSQALDK
ncbi:hypothetical protein SEPCBS57363_004789 [Sporothrix epigloea]|uniref:Uncharacterized protein n=1 Tax=Sporothrix epigloea TaxID=1892477 RepID=A0ABP0DTZ5_9PEZI